MKVDLQIIKEYEPVFNSRGLYRYICLYGGRGSAKSWFSAQYAVMLSLSGSHRIVFSRQVMLSIKDSSKKLIWDTILRMKLDKHFEQTNTTIRCISTGSEFMFVGLARNIESVKSIEDISLFVIEEAQSVSEDTYITLLPTIRSKDSQIMILFNPQHELDPTYVRFVTNKPDNCLTIKTNYLQNPWIDSEFVKDAELMKEVDFNQYSHVYLGNPVGDDETSIIKSEWFNACIDAHIVLGFQAEGLGVVSLDPSDGGVDATATVYKKGSVVKHLSQKKNVLLEDSTTKAYDLAIEVNADHFIYDSVGLGVGCRVKLDQLDPNNKLNKIAFKASESASNELYQGQHKGREYFRNSRAELIFRLKDRIYNTYLAVVHRKYIEPSKLISFDSSCISKEDLDQLKYEATNIRELPKEHLKQIESKKDMANRGLKSPNLFDALYQTELTPKKVVTTSFNFLM